MVNWSTPLPLITCKRGRFQLDDQTIVKLQSIDKPIAVVCIAGLFRTGKSYLMNRLMEKQSGFALGNTVEAKTKGIWVWYKEDPNVNNRGILVIDTEGLDDPDKGDETNDMHILSLSILLSSTFIYNVVGKLDNSVIDRLDFVTELSKHVRVKSSVNNDSDFDSFFPHFILVCRDKILELKMNGKEVTADEYMERVMLTASKKNSMTDKEIKRNETKMKLRRYFPHRKCFFFVRPAKTDDDMLRLEELTESDLQEKFLIESDKFCSYVNNTLVVKKLQTKPITGRIFVHLAKIYTDAMNDNAIPCIASALTLVSTTENTKLLEDCATKYNESMSKLKLPMEEEKFEKSHKKNHKVVVYYFASKAFLDERNEYHEKLQILLQNVYISYVQKNCGESNKLCNEILDKLFEPIQKKLNDGFYHCGKGYEKFIQDSEDLQRKYNSVPNKGVLANVALEKFLIRMQENQNLILKADEELSKKEKELEEERLKQEEAESKLKIETEKLRQIEQHQQQLISSHEEQMRAIEKKFQENLEEVKRKNEELNRAREAEQKRLNEERYAEEARRWKQQLEEQSKREKEEKRRMEQRLEEESNRWQQSREELEELRESQQSRNEPQQPQQTCNPPNAPPKKSNVARNVLATAGAGLLCTGNPIVMAGGALLTGLSLFF